MSHEEQRKKSERVRKIALVAEEEGGLEVGREGGKKSEGEGLKEGARE